MLGQQRDAFRAAAQMVFHPGPVGGGQFPVVEGGQQRLRFPAIHYEPPPGRVPRAASSRVRARERRDITVPAGIPAAKAISP